MRTQHLLWAILFVCCIQFAHAQDYSIFVHGHAYDGKIILRKKMLYVALKPMAKFLNLGIKEEKNKILVGITPENNVQGNLVVNGKQFSNYFVANDKKTYVALKPFAESAGEKVLINQETKIVDVIPKNSPLDDAVVRLMQGKAKETQPVHSGIGEAKSGNNASNAASDPVKVIANDVGLNMPQFNACIDAHKHEAVIKADFDAGRQLGVNGTPTFFLNGKLLEGMGGPDDFEQLVTQANTPGQVLQTVDTGHLPPLGNRGTKLTLVEFTDLQCYYCRQFWKQTFPYIKSHYIDTGKMAFYIRHFPLTKIHPLAVPLANGAECANEQGRFWEFQEAAFK